MCRRAHDTPHSLSLALRTLAQAAKTPSAQDLRTLGVPNASIMQAEHDAARKLKVKQANEDFEQKQAELVRAVSPMSALTSEDSARDYAERTEVGCCACEAQVSMLTRKWCVSSNGRLQPLHLLVKTTW